ncbi:sucrose transport protein SUF1, partial [Trifolium medium]|nr:sucrose transport protein SUF1 [Trifolium medium]
MTLLITKEAQHESHIGGKRTPSAGINAAVFVFFAVLGVPLA